MVIIYIQQEKEKIGSDTDFAFGQTKVFNVSGFCKEYIGLDASM